MTKIINKYGIASIVTEQRAVEMVQAGEATIVPEDQPKAAEKKEAPLPDQSKEDLQSQLDQLGVIYDKRWGVDRLKETLELNIKAKKEAE